MKLFFEQPKCVIIRLDILQAYRSKTVGPFSLFADRLLCYTFDLSDNFESIFYDIIHTFLFQI